MKNFRRVLSSLAALALAGAATGTALAQPPDQTSLTVDERPRSSPAENLSPAVDVEVLSLPLIPDDLMTAAAELTQTFDGHRQLGSVGISEDRTAIEVHWHGDTHELDPVVGLMSAQVAIREARIEPGLLREVADSLIRGDAGVQISSVVIEPDGSGLQVSVKAAADPARLGQGHAAREQASVREFAGVPVEFVASPEPADATSRQSDFAGMGGARIWQYHDGRIVNACTTAFAVIRPDSLKKGMLTAAHCSDIGARWAVHNGVPGSNSYVLYGDVVSRNETYDAAVIESTWSYPYIYAGAWNSSTYTPINGMTIPVVGTELCYSGSYSGLVCGNIVRAAESLSEICDQFGQNCMRVRSFLSEHHTGVPSVGQGDSGGPGYVLTNTSSGVKRYAATIISGIRHGSTWCSGLSEVRLCSSTVLSTSVVEALRANGWALQVLN